jgi:hypothetical protein
MPKRTFTRKRGGGFFNTAKKAFNRLRGRTARVQPAPAAPAAPARKPIVNHETFKEAYVRCVWYFMKRAEGKTHQELEQYLDIPGSFVVSQEDYDEFLNDMIHTLDTEFEGRALDMANHLKEHLFNDDFDREWNSWESAKRGREECPRDGCRLYRGTRVEKKPFNNVANTLHRFIALLKEIHTNPSMLNYRTNYTTLGCDYTNSYLIFNPKSFLGMAEDGFDTFSLYVVLPDEYRAFHPQTATATPNGCFENMLSSYSMTRASMNRHIYLMSPLFAYRFMKEYPGLYEQAFGTASGWMNMSPLDRMRMAVICWITARDILVKTKNPFEAQQAYFSYPSPTIEKFNTIPIHDPVYWHSMPEYTSFDEMFEAYQTMVANENSTSSKIMSIDEYLGYLDSYASSRNELFRSKRVNLPELNNVVGVAYDPETEVTNINRAAWYGKVFRNRTLPFHKKAAARNLLQLAKQQKGQPFMTEAELNRARAQFGVTY